MVCVRIPAYLEGLTLNLIKDKPADYARQVYILTPEDNHWRSGKVVRRTGTDVVYVLMDYAECLYQCADDDLRSTL